MTGKDLEVLLTFDADPAEEAALEAKETARVKTLLLECIRNRSLDKIRRTGAST